MPLPVLALFFSTLIGAFFAYILLRSEYQRINVLFATFSVVVAVWALNLGLFLLADTKSLALLHANIYYAAAASIPLILLFFSQYFKRDDRPFRWKSIFFVLPLVSLILAFIYFPNLIVEDVILQDWGKDVVLNRIFYGVYMIYFLIYVLLSYANLRRTYKRKATSKESKKQILFVIYGLFVGYIIGTFFNLFLPAFGNYRFIWAGPLGLLVVVGLIGYAIVRYRLFNIKVILTELLVSVMWLFILIRMIVSDSQTDQIANGILLLITSVAGMFLIRSVQKEINVRKEIEKLAVDLKSANTRLQEMDKQKTEFLSIASHQFRSPITAIKGYTSLILEGAYGVVPEKLKEPIDRVFTSTNNLALVVDDFLNLSRIEQGRMNYEFEKVDLKEFVKQAVDEQRAVASKKGTTLSFSVEEGETYGIEIDRGKFKQVVTNLIDNALKYTPKGSIHVKLEREQNTIRISIKDTGIGISKENISKLFGQFVRATNANSVNVSGTGLGLYIVKQIVEAHEGKVWVESEGEGKGSTFIVEIPTKS